MARGIFYVASDVKHLPSITIGERTWWCVAKASETGDIGVIYQKKTGIRFVFKFLEFEEDNEFCKTFSMSTGHIEMLSIIDPPITFPQLRSSAFRSLKAVRRSFQSRWFDIEETYLPALLEFLSSGQSQ